MLKLNKQKITELPNRASMSKQHESINPKIYSDCCLAQIEKILANYNN